MSTTIDERVVEMRFDNRNFEKNVKTSMSTLDKLKKSLNLKGASDGLENVSKTASKVTLDPMAKSIDAVQAKFSYFQATVQHQLNRIVDSAVDTGRRLVNAFTIEPVKTGFNEYELKMGSVQTIMASTGESLQTVNKYLEELNTYSDKTIYSFSDMTQNIGKFTNAGVKLEDAVAAIKGVSNEAAVSGANAQEASRAMYNFAQALSAGYVKLIDWKSIENANMATVEFKQQLLDTALALGTVVKVGDQYKTVTTNAKGKVSDLFDATRNFNDSLSNQWMTTDVLTKTLAKYADETTDIGKKAYAAAQDVKTFSMMMDTLKEAAQSGWAQTWELIVGDFEEAKALFTEAAEFFGGIIDKASKARNNLLKGALDNVIGKKDWLQLTNAGKATKDFQNLLIEVAKEHNVAIDSMIKAEGSFANTLQNGWLTDELYKEALGHVTDAEKELIKEEAAGIKSKKERIKYTKQLTDEVKKADKPYSDLMEKMNRPSGRDLLIDTLRNSLKALVIEINGIKKAWSDVFPKTTSEDLYNIIERLHDFSVYLTKIDEDGSKVGKSFRGLFSILHIISNLFGGAFKIGLKVVQAILSHFNLDILDVTASIGDAIYNFDRWIEKNDFIAKGVDKVITVIEKGITILVDWVNTIKEIPEVQAGIEKFNSSFISAIESLDVRIANIKQRIDEFIDRVQSLDHIGLDNIDDVFKDFYDNVLSYMFDFKGIFKNAKTSFEEFKTSIMKGLTESDGKFAGFKDTIIKYASSLRDKLEDLNIFGSLLTIGTGMMIYKSAKKIMSIFDAFAGFAKTLKAPLEALTGALNELKPTLRAYAFELKSKGILNIAFAIAVLAGSLAVLSLCDSKKLLLSAVALGIVSVALSGLCLVLGKFSSVDIGKVSVSMVSIASSLLILVVALKKLEDVKIEGIWERLGVLAALAAGLLVFGGITSILPGMNKGAISMLAFAVALRVILNALQKINDLNLTNIDKAIDVLNGILLSMAVLSVASKGLSVKSGIGLIAMAVTLRMFINAFEKITEIDLKKIQNGIPLLLSIFGSFIGLIVVSRLAGKNAAQAGVMMLAISVSLLIMAKAIKKIGKLSAHDIEKGIGAISGLLLVFAAVVGMSKFAGEHAAKAGAMLLGMTGTFLAVTVAMAILGRMKDDQINRALKAIAGVSACFSLLITSTGLSKFDKGTKNGIMAITVAIGAMAIALGALSFISPERLKSSTIALSSVMAMFAVITASTKLMNTGTTKTLLVMTGAIGILGGIIYLLGQLPVKNALGSAGALSLLLTALTGSLILVSKVQTVSGKSLAVLYAMSGVVAILATIMGVMSALNVEPSIETALSLSTLLLAMSTACLILSAVGPNASHALLGAAALDGVLAIIGAFVLGIGAIFSQDFMSKGKEYIEKGFEILNTISYGLGSFVGSLIGGLSDGIMSGLPAIGTYLSQFADNAQGFLNCMTNLDPNIATSAKNLALALLAICAAEVLESITGWLTGSSDMEEFGSKLKTFGQGLVDFSDVVKGKIDKDSVETATNAGKMITELADSIPNSGGLLGVLAGNNDVDTFGKKLKKFAEGLVDFSTIVKGKIDTDSVETAANAGKMITELADSVPNSGGLLGGILGDNDIKDFGSKLKAFAQGVVDFSETVKGKISSSSVETATNAGKLITGLAKSVPNSGGWLGKIFGDNDIKDFSKKLKGFGDGLAAFCTGELSKVSVTDLQLTVSKLSTILAILKNVSSTKTENIKSFNKSMKELAKTSIDGFVKEFSDSNTRVTTSIKSFFNLISYTINSFMPSFYSAGNNATTGFLNGLMYKVNNGQVYGAGYAIGNKALEAAKKALDEHSPSKKMEKVGKFAVDGFVKGLTKSGVKISTVTDAIFKKFVNTTLNTVTASTTAKGAIESYAKSYVTNTKKIDKQRKIATKALKSYTNEIYKSSSYYEEDKKNLSDHLKQLKQYYTERTQLNSKLAKAKSKSDKSSIQKSIKENEKNIKAMKKQIDKDQKQMVKNAKKALNEVKKAIKDAVKDYTNIFNIAFDKINLFGSSELTGKSAIKSIIQSSLGDLTSLSNFDLSTGINFLEKFSSSTEDLAESVQTATDNLTDSKNELTEAEDELRKAQAKSLAVDGRSQKYLEEIAEAEEKVAEAKTKVAQAEENLSKVTKSTSAEMLENMKSNIDGYKEWKDNLDKLSSSGISNELLQYLKGLGISGADQVSAFVKMTETELKQANEYWKTYSSMSSQTFIDGIKDKSKAMAEWGEDIKKFADLNIDDTVKSKLLQEFESQGIDSSDYIKQILSMSTTELNDFVNSYKEMISIPEKVAEEVSKSIDTVNKKTDASKAIMNSYINAMKENLQAEKDYDINLKKLKKNGVSDGLYDQLVETGDRQLIASFAKASKEEINEVNAIFAESAKQSADRWLTSYSDTIADTTKWQNNMKKLSKLDIPAKIRKSLYAEFEEKKMEGNDLLEMILGLDDKQLDKFVKSYKKTGKVATSIANDVVAGSAFVSAETKEKMTDEAKQAATDAMDAMNKAIKSSESKIKKSSKTVGTSAVKEVKKSLNKTNGKQIGDDVCTGIKKGLEDGKDKIKKIAYDIGKDAINSAKKALDSHSPSKKFMQLGRDCDEGLAIGLSNYSSISENAAESMSNNVIGMMRNSIAQISEWANRDIDSSPTIRPILDMSDIQKQVGSISSMFGTETIGVNANMASRIASRMNASYGSQNGSTTNNSYDQSTQTMNNTFNITGDNPKEIANEVSKILQHQVNRRSVTWA